MNDRTGTILNDGVVLEEPAGIGVESCSLVAGRGAATRLGLKPEAGPRTAGSTDAKRDGGDGKAVCAEGDETGVEIGSLMGWEGAAIGLRLLKPEADVNAKGRTAFVAVGADCS